MSIKPSMPAFRGNYCIPVKSKNDTVALGNGLYRAHKEKYPNQGDDFTVGCHVRTKKVYFTTPFPQFSQTDKKLMLDGMNKSIDKEVSGIVAEGSNFPGPIQPIDADNYQLLESNLYQAFYKDADLHGFIG